MNDEILDATSQVSQVSGDSVSRQRKAKMGNILWLSVLVFTFIMMIIFFSGSSKDKNQQTGKNNDNGMASNPHQYDDTIQANLAKLKKEEQENALNQLKQASQKNSRYQTNFTDNNQSKEYIARQNAPTSMYSANMLLNLKSKQQSEGQQNQSTNKTLVDSNINADFVNRHSTTTTITANKIKHPEATIASGEFIQAILETAINSNLPGMVRAITTEPVYAYTGRKLLIPPGSRLIGQYTASVNQGQNRVMAVWNRIILPDGITVNINSPSTDTLGRAGQNADSINTHFFARFGESALLSIIGAGVANMGVNKGDENNSSAQYRMAISQSFQQSAQQSLQGTLPMKPTLHVHQGALINVFVAHDLDFEEVKP